MKSLRSLTLAAAGAVVACALPSSTRAGAPEAAALSAADLAAQLSALVQDGSSYVRLRLDTRPSPGAAPLTLQLQIKARRTASSTELVYQVLWPKERKGESILLRKVSGRPASGAHFVPPGPAQAINASRMADRLFGSDLIFEDVLEDFFSWDQQKLVGTEVVDRISCHILESRPGKSDRSNYTRVRTWIDTRRMVPLRVEKYLASGQLARRIVTTRVVATDNQRHIPANLTISSPGTHSTTDLDGSRIKHDVVFSDRDFSQEGFHDMTVPRSSGR